MFNIGTLKPPANNMISSEISINDFNERFDLPLHYWSEQDYAEQWIDAMNRIIEGSTKKTAIITGMPDPHKPQFAVTWWPLYREGNTIYIRNAFFPFELKGDQELSLESLYGHISTRQPEDEVSEWKITLHDLETFRDHLLKRQQEE